MIGGLWPKESKQFSEDSSENGIYATQTACDAVSNLEGESPTTDLKLVMAGDM